MMWESTHLQWSQVPRYIVEKHNGNYVYEKMVDGAAELSDLWNRMLRKCFTVRHTKSEAHSTHVFAQTFLGYFQEKSNLFFIFRAIHKNVCVCWTFIFYFLEQSDIF